MLKRKASRLYALLCTILFALPSTSATIARFEDAQLRENAALVYPPAKYESGHEGWAVLSYVVTREGSVVDPLIEDSSGVAAFDKAALDSVSRLRYTPATIDGEPTERCFTQQKITFQIPPDRYHVARKFENRLTTVTRLTEAKKFDKASAELAPLAVDYPKNLYEDARFWLADASLLRAQGNLEGEIRSLRRAIAYQGIYLPDTLYSKALERLYNVETQTGRLVDALATSDRLAELGAPRDGVAEILAHAAQSRNKLEDLSFFSTPRKITASGRARHPLLRRKFSFLVESGQLSDFELRCTAHRSALAIKPEAAWTVPADWGDCVVYVAGEAGTVFYVNEMR